MELPAAKKTNGGYVIKYEGVEYTARKQGAKWELKGQIFAKLKDVKTHIVENSSAEEIVTKEVERIGLWDCMRPICIVVLLLKELGREPNAIEKDTLDALGMLVDDQMDIAGAERELQRIRNILREA